VASLTILDVGHGNSAVVRLDAAAAVIDAGPGTALLEFLQSEGINEVALLLISHADSDHLKGLVALLGHSGIAVRRVLLNTDSAKKTKIWKALAFELDDRHRRGEIEFDVQLKEGDLFELGEGVTIEVLAPRPALVALGAGNSDDDDERIHSNSMSAVIRTRLRDGRRVLLTGDMDALGLKHLRLSGQDLSSDVLVFPHHGGHTSASSSNDENRAFTAELLTLVNPSSVVFSTGRGSRQNPRGEIVEVIRTAEQKPVIMCTQLSTQCASSVPTEDPDHLSPKFAMGRDSRSCCAGTIILEEDVGLPDFDAHTAFLVEHAPTALCRIEEPTTA
jgi:beta-lactamase superfamily II metal-dependent hydrolase